MVCHDAVELVARERLEPAGERELAEAERGLLVGDDVRTALVEDHVAESVQRKVGRGGASRAAEDLRQHAIDNLIEQAA